MVIYCTCFQYDISFKNNIRYFVDGHEPSDNRKQWKPTIHICKLCSVKNLMMLCVLNVQPRHFVKTRRSRAKYVMGLRLMLMMLGMWRCGCLTVMHRDYFLSPVHLDCKKQLRRFSHKHLGLNTQMHKKHVHMHESACVQVHFISCFMVIACLCMSHIFLDGTFALSLIWINNSLVILQKSLHKIVCSDVQNSTDCDWQKKRPKGCNTLM